jgi:hypothetical protein
MTQPVRAAGKPGRRAPKNAPAIKLGDVLRSGATIPPHPDTEDYLAQLSGWQVLGNDVAGDCVAVTWANMRRLVTKFLSTEVYPTQDQVWEVYKTQNPSFDPNGTADTNGPGSQADQGMDIQTLLEYLTKNGGPDGVKPLAFAKVDYTNQQELEAALAIFGGVWTGVNVLQANMDEFNQGQPWDYVEGSPLDGGHSVLAGGYNPNVRFITWGAETEFTPAFVEKLVEETWAVVWPEMLGTAQFEAGIDQTVLAAAYQELTGRPFPVQPTPEPTPAPVPEPPAPAPTPEPPAPSPTPVPPVPEPVPVPEDADVTFAQVLHHFSDHPWLYNPYRLAHDARQWLKAKGL